MSLEAPISKYKKHNLLILIGIMLVLAGWFYYDGYYSQKFIKEHTTTDGKPDGTLQFNRKSPPYMLIIAALAAARFWMIKDHKIVADEQGLRYGTLSIPYDRIDSIDKTHFDSKGFFVIHYKDDQQQVKQLQLSDRKFDRLPAILDHLVSKITS